MRRGRSRQFVPSIESTVARDLLIESARGRPTAPAGGGMTWPLIGSVHQQDEFAAHSPRFAYPVRLGDLGQREGPADLN